MTITGYAPLFAGPVSTAISLPAGDSPTTVSVSNLGPQPAAIALGASGATADFTSGTLVLPGAAPVQLPIGSATYLAAIAGPAGKPQPNSFATLVVTVGS